MMPANWSTSYMPRLLMVMLLPSMSASAPFRPAALSGGVRWPMVTAAMRRGQASISSIVAQHGPQGQQQQVGEWTNAEMNKLSAELEVEVDMQKRRAMFRRMLEICEREDPAYTVLHQNATFTAKRKDIKWKASPSFAMEFRSTNFATN